jgi:hypothetical protein
MYRLLVTRIAPLALACAAIGAACSEPEANLGDSGQRSFEIIYRDVRAAAPDEPACPDPQGCGEQPARYFCPGGAVGNVADRCLLRPTGECKWAVKGCEPVLCDPSECGRFKYTDEDGREKWPPFPSFTCEDGTPGGWTDRCIQAFDGGCAWERIGCDPLTR